ncbi:class I adenylate-forming enzyme family protein [Feifania hominis]|uniref:Acyl--CoA ligase n=1 Tax=Feifania hominis TaxID=2763660 RepID=A0A926DC61_9FIRM|nr:class I adenylate-forming enzyme family protein [Feifania hominis]MBC8535393.1 acyl--CoA ligase [Feifania hominis]
MSDNTWPWMSEYEKLGLGEPMPVPSVTLYERVEQVSRDYPDYAALEFMGRDISYRSFMEMVDKCAASLAAHGIKKGDVVAICMPNIPQTAIAFYAVNRLGAKSCMIHPMSSSKEIRDFVNSTGAKAIFFTDLFYRAVADIAGETGLEKLFLASIAEFLSPVVGAAFKLKIRKVLKRQNIDESKVVRFRTLLNSTAPAKPYERLVEPNETAAILFSGGTSSGNPKGIELSSDNFNVLSVRLLQFIPEADAGDRILTILPLFHGFGLGICVHTMLSNGLCCILVPQFSAAEFVKTIRKKKPQFLAGVPSMFDALMNEPKADKLDYSFVKGAFCGGDTVPPELKKRFNAYLKAHNSSVCLREGYGLTECVTCCMLAPRNGEPFNSMGLPLPGVLVKVVEPGTQNEVPLGQEGELCISSDTVMVGYLDSPEENAKTLQVHADGRTWMHSGDMCYMDENGYSYFKQRIKRIIKVRGFPVYPSVIEDTIRQCKGVKTAAVLGLPDEKSGERVKAYVVMEDPSMETEENQNAIIEYCRSQLNKWSVPRLFEYRSELPLTKVGKISIPALLQEELAKKNQ